MTEQENLPAVAAAQDVDVSTAQRGSLVGRGLAAIRVSKKQQLSLFDEETYAKAKPFFEMAIADMKLAATDIREMLVAIVRSLVQNGLNRSAIKDMSPYLERFLRDSISANVDFLESRQPKHPQRQRKGNDTPVSGKSFGANDFPMFADISFDENTYQQAKPHFEAALKALQDAGKTVKDLFRFLIEQFGLGVKPYAIQFAKDMRLSTRLNQKIMPKKAESEVRVSEKSKTALIAEDVRERLSQKYYKLGSRCYDSRNYEQARSWYRTAANRGHFLSQLFLAEMYEDGRGIKDDKQAAFWFKKALETMPDSTDARRGLNRLGFDWKE